MNVGLEDAFLFSWLVLRGDLRRCDHLRRPTDRRVVKRVELLTRLAR